VSETTDDPPPLPPAPGVWRRAWVVATSDKISLTAAGCAFYAMLALFPALSLAISLYGLLFDLAAVEPQLEVLRRILPEDSYELIATRVHDLVSSQPPKLEIGFALSSLLAFWSASAGVRSLLGALNLAHDQAEERGFVEFYVTAFLLTLGAIMAVVMGLGFLVLLPKGLDLFGLDRFIAILARSASMALMILAVLIGVSLLYRFGPARVPENWRLFSTGALAATLFWAIASVLFSLYVTNFSGYDATYGTLGAAVALLMWLYVSVYVILLGAELNAEIERSRPSWDPRS
jgi:membrane protein